MQNPSYHQTLWQARPTANVVTTLVDFQHLWAWTNSISSFARVYTIYCHNMDFQSWTQDLISLWLVPPWQTLADKHCILNNYPASNAENILKVELMMVSWSKIFVKSSKGISSFSVFGEVFPFAYDDSLIYNTIMWLLKKVEDGTATVAEKEKLLYLQWWCKVDITNNVSCPSP
jgi:hypothetical protein